MKWTGAQTILFIILTCGAFWLSVLFISLRPH